MPPWHLQAKSWLESCSVSIGQYFPHSPDFPEMQVPGLVQGGLLSVQPLSKKQVCMERKSKKVKSVHSLLLKGGA